MSTTNIRQKPIKGRTIVTKFKNHANITLEKLAEEYGWETKKFFELLEKAVGSETFSELQKTNAKRNKKLNKKEASNDIMEEEFDMKARISSINPVEPKTSIDFKEELKLRTLVAGKKAPTTDTNSNQISDEMNSKQVKTTESIITMDELQEKKRMLETQVKALEESIDTQNLLLQMAEEEKNGIEEKIDNLKANLTAAEAELTNKAAEISKIHENISGIQSDVKKYRDQLDEVEAAIDNLTIVYLVAPCYKASRFPTSGKLVSNVNKEIKGIKAEVVEMPKIKLPFTPEEIEDFGYDSNAKFREDYNFVLLVKKFKEDGGNVKVLAHKSGTVNRLLDSVIGEGKW